MGAKRPNLLLRDSVKFFFGNVRVARANEAVIWAGGGSIVSYLLNTLHGGLPVGQGEESTLHFHSLNDFEAAA